jgi:hypothetical protein
MPVAWSAPLQVLEVDVRMAKPRHEAGFEFYHEVVYTLPGVAARIFTASKQLNGRFILYNDEYL